MNFAFAFESKEKGLMKRDPRSSSSKNILTREVKNLIFGVGVVGGELGAGGKEAGTTLTLNVVCAASPFPVAYAVIAYIPRGVVGVVVIIIVVPHGGMQEEGANKNDESEGSPAAEKATFSSAAGLIKALSVFAALCPWAIVTSPPF